MNGCMCGCCGNYGPRFVSWGYGPRFAPWPSREDRIQRLEDYQRDLERQAADVAAEIGLLKGPTQPQS